MSYGYDLTIVSFTLGQPSFYKYMHLTMDSTDIALYAHTNEVTGAMLGLFAAGGILGALFIGWFGDSYGRKKSLIIAAIINCIGGGLQTGSVNPAMFIVGRFVSGFAAGIVLFLA
jgi:MFS family permease